MVIVMDCTELIDCTEVRGDGDGEGNGEHDGDIDDIEALHSEYEHVGVVEALSEFIELYRNKASCDSW